MGSRHGAARGLFLVRPLTAGVAVLLRSLAVLLALFRDRLE